MAEEPENICEWLDIDLDRLSPEDKINLIGEIADELTAQQLRNVREIINQKRLRYFCTTPRIGALRMSGIF